MISSSNRNIYRGSECEVSRFSPPTITPPERKEQDAEEKADSAEDEFARSEPPPVAEQDRIIEEAKRQAEAILAEAEKKAEALREKILNEVNEEAENIRREARELGFDEGHREGLKKAESESSEQIGKVLNQLHEDIQTALENIETAKEECLRRYEGELLDCATAVAEKVIHISLHSSGEVMKRMILSATEKLKKTAWVKIYIDSFDYSMMSKIDADVAAQLAVLSDNIKFVIMDKEGEGTCIIEMPEGVIDTSVSTQMENIREILEGVKP